MAFGSFDSLCRTSPLPVCSILGPLSTITNPPSPVIPTTCYARSIELANTIIFQAATDFAHIVALGMTCIMILHVRSKFTAVGRKEILTFFYIYLSLTVVSLVLDAGVLEARNGGVFPWFVAVQNGLASSLCACLLVNGFVGFQLYEDGTTLSVWLLRLSSLGTFVISFAVSLLTFKSWAGLSPTNTTGLFVVLYLLNGICLFVYLAMQVILVLYTLQDRWPLGDLMFGVFFFVAGQVILYVFSDKICGGASHYLDGLFFATVCNLLGVMMVYKYWDSITREDLEFSVGTKQGNWEVKDPLLDAAEERRTSMFDLTGAMGPTPGTGRSSLYDAASLHMDQQTQPGQGYGHRNTQSHGNSHSRGQSRERMGYITQQNFLESPLDMQSPSQTQSQSQSQNQRSHGRQVSSFGLLMDREHRSSTDDGGIGGNWKGGRPERQHRSSSSYGQLLEGSGNSRPRTHERMRSYQDAY